MIIKKVCVMCKIKNNRYTIITLVNHTEIIDLPELELCPTTDLVYIFNKELIKKIYLLYKISKWVLRYIFLRMI